MTARLTLVLLLLTVTAHPAELVERPVSVTFVPPISTYGTDGRNTVSDFSFNIIGGYIGSVREFELGGLFNIVRFDLRGAQVAGVFNLVGGSVHGLQVAPVNVIGGGLRGVQVGAVNVAGDSARGAQVGSVNFAAELHGLQVGNVNVSGDMRGVKVGNVNLAGDIFGLQAGNVNVAGELRGAQVGNVNSAGAARGAQVGNVNVAGEFDGIQVGNVNVGGSGRGFMLGNVNVAEHLDGEALGNVSVIGNGYRAYTAWADETGTAQLGVKLGSRSIYNVFGLGVVALADSGARWLFSYGLGGHFPFNDRLFLDADGSWCAVSEPGSIWRSRGEQLFRARPQLGLRLFGPVAAVAGPVFTLRITGEQATDRLAPVQVGFNEGWFRQDRDWYQAWVGLMFGIQIHRVVD